MEKLKAVLAICLLGTIILSGCGISKEKNVSKQAHVISIVDDLGREIELPHVPERIVALSPSFLEPLGVLDANLIGRPSSKSGSLSKYANIEEVGAVYHINIEKVVSLQPDLVIAYQGMHEKFLPILEANEIPVLVVRMKTYQEVLDKIALFAKITGQLDQGTQLIEKIRSEVQSTFEKLPQDQKSVVILHSTAKSVTVELEQSIAGSVAKMLHLRNIAAGSIPLEGQLDSAPYSLERLVENDPDLIFVVTMGELEAIKKRMTEDVTGSPAWNSLRAVQNGQIYYLPQELFLLNPGIRYPEAVKLMAKLAYPEVFDYAR